MVKLKQSFKQLAAISTVVFALPFSAFAQNNNVNITPPGGYSSLVNYGIGDYVRAGVNILLGLSGVIAFFYLLWGGIQWIMAGGDKEGTEKARKKITAALIGLAIVFSAYALLFIIKALFGVDVLAGFTLQQLGSY